MMQPAAQRIVSNVRERTGSHFAAFFLLQIHFHRFDIDGSLPSFPCLQPLLPLATSDQSVGFITPTHRAASVNYPALQSPIDHEIIAYNTMPKAPVVDHELVQRPLVLIYNVPILSSTCYPFVTTPLIDPFRSCVSVFLSCVFVCFYFFLRVSPTCG